MVFLIFGPPGSGKGTQSQRLMEALEVEVISTGEMLRQAAAAQTDFGRALAKSLARGDLTSDETVNRIVLERLAGSNGRGVILDGYPRTVNQAKYLDGVLAERQLPHPVVIHLDVPASVIVERLSARRQCVCGRVYNLLQQRPKIDGQCDECGHQLTVRSDDDPVVIERRLHAYQKSTGPVLAHYAGVSYYAVDGNRDSETVFAEVLGIVQPALHK